jgi:flagellum-specific peptidoglycan hydrolase FlgJ
MSTAAEITRVDDIQKRLARIARNEYKLNELQAEIILAQTMIEASDSNGVKYNSNNFRKNNNLFGMKEPRKRKSPYIRYGQSKVQPPAGEGATPYAYYSNIEDSLRDLFHWHKYNGIDMTKISTAQEYANVLKSKGYYGITAGQYGSQLATHMQRITKNVIDFIKNPVTVSVTAIVLILTTVFF